MEAHDTSGYEMVDMDEVPTTSIGRNASDEMLSAMSALDKIPTEKALKRKMEKESALRFRSSLRSITTKRWGVGILGTRMIDVGDGQVELYLWKNPPKTP